MHKKVTILKIGGSVVTHKRREGGLRQTTVRKIAKELYRAIHQNPQNLILIHGAGGEAHKIAHSFNLKEGAVGKSGIKGALKTHTVVASLNQDIATIFQKENVPVFPMQTNAFFYRRKSRLVFHNFSDIEKIMSLGMIPLFYGDMIQDDLKNFSILSGDTIAMECAKKFKAERILFATDVDGIYAEDPQVNTKAKLVPIITRKEAGDIFKKTYLGTERDTTGQMRGKLKNILNMETNADILIFNGLKTGNIKKALTKKIVGTHVKK